MKRKIFMLLFFYVVILHASQFNLAALQSLRNPFRYHVVKTTASVFPQSSFASLSLLGALQYENGKHALLVSDNGVSHWVSLGSLVGLRQGKVIGISREKVVLQVKQNKKTNYYVIRSVMSEDK